MTRYSWLLCSVVILLTTTIGCSNESGNSPVMPNTTPAEIPGLTGDSVVPDVGTGGHLLSGYWQILLNIQEGDLDVIPLRGTSMHLNLAGILCQNPDWLSVHVNDINIPGRLLDFDITITHPVPNSDIRVFDMRGILMGLGDTLSASSDAGLVYTGPDGIRLLNSDGYTRWWNAVEFTTPGIFGYDNDFIVPDFIIPTTTLNPYKYFADALDPTDDVIPSVDDTNRGTFSTTGTPPSVTRNYLVRFPLEADQPKLGFHFAMDLSFAPATGGNPTPKPIGDFPLAANMPEAFYIDVNMDNSWVWYMDDENRGGNLVLDIEVFDWGAMENPDGISGEIESITLESKTLFPNPVNLETGPMTGTQSTSGIFHITIPNCTPTGFEDQEILVTVKSSYPATYAPPVSGPDWPQNAHLAAYTLVEVPILIAEPSFVSITVVSPNGGEVWPITSQQEILWSWTDVIPMVDIDLSVDGGQTYEISLAADIENTGSFLVEAVGDWSSDSAKIRVSSSSEQEVNDVSDGNFLIEPDIHLEAPNGGEYWIAGNMYEITWVASSSIENVMILLSENSGLDYSKPIDMATPNDGSYKWYIDPAVYGGDHCRIKVVDVLPTLTGDESDNDFSIFDENYSPIRLTSPNGDEIWKAQTAAEITWEADPDVMNVRIELSFDAGLTYPFMVIDSTPNTGTFGWDPIPDEAIGEYNRIKITNVDNPTETDISNGTFSIKPMGLSYIQIQTPGEGESWQIGCGELIEWDSDGIIPMVDILVNMDNVGTYSTVSDDLANIGWALPTFEPDGITNLSLWDDTEITGSVRVESSSDPGVFDEILIVVPINLGILYDMVQQSEFGDADLDNIPDDVELFIGTDPLDRDCDIPNPDSMFDNYEIFGNGYFDPYDLIPDLDGDGVIAPLDMDDNMDGVNDGEQIDTDLDGIPNYLEYYGYTYDWMSGTYNLWDGSSIDEPYFKTDPLQPSTDQDPYSDSMEVSGAFMDVSVEEPGDYPMVPAYPNIIVRLEGYEVTVKQEITLEEGSSLEKGTEWSSETSREHSYEKEQAWEVSAGTELGYDGGPKAVVQVSGSYGETYHNTNTTAVTRSNGGSVATTKEWSQATCTDTTEAAWIKLYLKVYNMGTSCASNISPTITLKIGNKNVETFEPSTLINILEPGGVYPSQPGTYWVVDKIDTGMTVPLALTLDELRALECGAPVSVVMTQMDAEVMLMNESGQWESAGDWGEYMARCEAVCTNMYLEAGGGNFLHYLVYSDDESSSPEVTFGDALVWAAGAETTATDLWLTYNDENGQEQTAALDDWEFNFDAQTLINNGFTVSPLIPPTPDYNIKDIVLYPFTQIIGKIPREGLSGVGAPVVIYAYFDGIEKSVTTLAADYSGIAGVEFIDKTGAVDSMNEVIAGSGLYTIQLDSGYTHNGTELVRAYSVDTTVPYTEADVEKLVFAEFPEPVKPYIYPSSIYLDNRMFSVKVIEDEDWPTLWVTAQFSCTSEIINLTLGAPFGDYNDRWYARLPDCVTKYNYQDVIIKAGVSAEVFATDTYFDTYVQPTGYSYNNYYDWYSRVYDGPNPDQLYIGWWDLDDLQYYQDPLLININTNDYGHSGRTLFWEATNTDGDVFLLPMDGYWSLWWVERSFWGNAEPMPVGIYSGNKDYLLITEDDCKMEELFETDQTIIASYPAGTLVLSLPAVIIYQTYHGNFGKMRIREIVFDSGEPNRCNTLADYVTFGNVVF